MLEFNRGLNRKITLKDAQHRVFTIMTTEKPRAKSSSWATRISLFYHQRWFIETGFSELNRVNRRWKSNCDNVRYLDLLVRMLLYSSWKINKKLIKRIAQKLGRKTDWALNQNHYYLRQIFLSSAQKSRGCMEKFRIMSVFRP